MQILHVLRKVMVPAIRRKLLVRTRADGVVSATPAARRHPGRIMELVRRKPVQGRKAAGIPSDKLNHRGQLTTGTATAINSRALADSEVTTLLAIAHRRSDITRHQRRIIVPRLHRTTARRRSISVHPPSTLARRLSMVEAVVDVRPAVAAVHEAVAADILQAVAAITAANDLPSAAPADLTGLERLFFVPITERLVGGRGRPITPSTRLSCSHPDVVKSTLPVALSTVLVVITTYTKG